MIHTRETTNTSNNLIYSRSEFSNNQTKNSTLSMTRTLQNTFMVRSKYDNSQSESQVINRHTLRTVVGIGIRLRC